MKFGVKTFHVTHPAIHEKPDHAFCLGRKVRDAFRPRQSPFWHCSESIPVQQGQKCQACATPPQTAEKLSPSNHPMLPHPSGFVHRSNLIVSWKRFIHSPSSQGHEIIVVQQSPDQARLGFRFTPLRRLPPGLHRFQTRVHLFLAGVHV